MVYFIGYVKKFVAFGRLWSASGQSRHLCTERNSRVEREKMQGKYLSDSKLVPDVPSLGASEEVRKEATPQSV